jgi:hypothetical protein
MVSQTILVALTTVIQTSSAIPSWKPYSPSSSAYTVLLPGKPVEKKQTLVLSSGADVEMSVASVKVSSITSYSVAAGHLDVLPVDPDAVLSAVRDEVIKRLKGTLLDETPGKQTDAVVRDFKIEIPKTVVANGALGRVRVILIDLKLYELIAVQSSYEAKMSADVVDAFFNSFKPPPKLSSELVVTVDDEPSAGKKSGATPKAEWNKFTAEDGSFTVLMLGKAIEKLERVKIPTVGEAPVRYVTVERGPHHSLAVMYQDYAKGNLPSAEIEKLYDKARQSAITNTGGKLSREKKVTVDKLSARELKIELPRGKIPGGGVMQARYFIHGSRFYQVVYKAPKAEYNAEDAQKFLESFRITAK